MRLVGVSNADPDQIREAAGITQLASVQNEFSPRYRSSEPECGSVPSDIAFLPWSPLGGIGKAGEQTGPFVEVARERGVSPQQVVLAWMLAKATVVLPIPGASRPESVRDSAAAADLVLTVEELARMG